MPGTTDRRATAMHELSMATEIVDSVKKSLEGKNVVRLSTVRLEIGELTMLGKDQLKFAWGILTQDGPLKGSKLVIVKKPALVECRECGFKGAATRLGNAGTHLAAPLIACPKCAGEVKIVGGRECIVRSLRAVTEDGTNGARVKGTKKRTRRRS